MGFWYGKCPSTAECQPHVDQPGSWANKWHGLLMCLCTCAYSSYQYCCDCKSSVEEGVCHIDWWKLALHGQSVFWVPQANLPHTHTNKQKISHQVDQLEKASRNNLCLIFFLVSSRESVWPSHAKQWTHHIVVGTGWKKKIREKISCGSLSSSWRASNHLDAKEYIH